MNQNDSTRRSGRTFTNAVAISAIIGLVGTLITLAAPTVGAVPLVAAEEPAPTVTFTAPPTTAAPGTPFGIEPRVTVTGTTADVTLSLTPITAGAAGVLTCASTTVSPIAGVATFVRCAIDRGGQFKLRASVAGITVESDTLTVAGPEFTAQPSGGVAGAAWAVQPVVRIVTGDGAPVVTDPAQSVGLVIKPGTGTVGASLTCTANPVDAVDGVATFAGCTIDRAGVGYQLLTAAKDGTVFGTSAAFDVTAGQPAKLAFTTQPAGGVAGAAFAAQPVVAVQDAFGNAVASTATIALQITTATGAALTCTTNPVPAVAGVAAFAGCRIDELGTAYTLTASSEGLTAAVSATLAIASGGASAISFVTSPGGGPGGAPFAVQPVVRLTDAGGNTVAGTATLSIKAGTGATGAALACAGNPAVGAPISFTGCTIDLANGANQRYVLVATSGSLRAESQPFDVTAGTARTAIITASPAAALGGATFAIRPRVELRDEGGNPAAGTVTLALAPGIGRPGAVLDCAGDANTATTNNGVATFDGCTIDQAGPDYRLIASVDGNPTVKDVSAPFTVSVGPAHHLAFTTSPAGSTGGVAFAVQPVVVVQDLGGNTIADSPETIALRVTQSTGTLACPAMALQVTAGAALFSGCSIDTAGTGYTLTASAGQLTGTSLPFDITPGAPAALVFSQQPGAATLGSAFGSQPVVTVVDAGGNGVDPSAPVVLSLTPGTGTVGAALRCATTSVVPSATGVAAFSGCSIDDAGAGFALTAVSNGLTAESLPFAVLLPVTTPLEQAPVGAPLGQTFGGSLYAINPTSVVNGVNSATGSLQYTVNDLTMVGVGMDLVLDRTYHSLDTAGGSFGPGWTSIFDLSVTLNPAGKVATVRAEDGQQLVFTRASSTAKFVAPPGARADLKCTAKTCTVTRWDGVSWTVTGTRLDNYLDANGWGLTFTYPTSTTTVVGVATADKKVTAKVVVTRSGGRISRVTTPTRSVRYAYTAGVLTSVTDVRGRTWSYGYTTNRLTRVTDPDAQVRLAVAYSAATGRVVAASTMGGPRHTDDTFSYDPITQRSTRTANTGAGPAAYVDTYRSNVLVRQDLPTAGTLRYSYDARLNVVALQDTTGFVQTRTYSAAGDLITKTTPLSSTRAAVQRFTYDNFHRLLTETDANGNTTTYGYQGPNLGSIIAAAPSAAETKLSYDNRGQLTSITTPMGRQSFTYDAMGNEATVIEAELSGSPINGTGTLSTYDEAGNRTSFVDARGTTRGRPNDFRTQQQYDAAGNLLKTIDPIGVQTTYTYDGAGDIATSTSPDGTTTFVWSPTQLTRTTITPAGSTIQSFDPSGNLLSERANTGGYTLHRYDVFGREIAITDPSGSISRFTYDAAGNVVLATSDDGSVLRRQYDALGRMIRSATASDVTLARYDLVGNTTQTTDGAGAVSTYAYDSHHKVTSVTDPAGTTSYQYDIGDNVARRTDGRGGITTYAYNGMSRMTSMTVDGNATTFSYDEMGNVVRTVDPAGRVTTLTLDARGRTTSTTYAYQHAPAQAIVVGQTFDWRDRRTSMSDSTGTYSYDYDARGNLVSAGTAGGTFTYDRTQPGRTIETYPDGTTVTYDLDDAGALMGVSAVKDGAVIASASYIRDLERRTTGVSLSNGVLESRGYDAAGRVVAQSVQRFGTVLAGDTYTYDANGNRLTQRTTAAGRSVSNAYAYDATGRVSGFTSTTLQVPAPVAVPTVGSAAQTVPAVPALSSPASYDLPTPQPANTPSGAIAPAAADWRYDAVGNRTATGPVSVQYGAGDRVTNQPGTTWTYDDSGAVTRISGPTSTRTFTYDAAARLATAVVTEGGRTSTATYTYDGDGNRIARTIDGVTTTYVWDPIGDLPMLVLERQGATNVQRRYVYGEGPVAMHTPTNTFYFHLDPLGSTNQVTDQEGDVVAAFNYDAFGTVTEVGPAAGQIDLLFQAQQFDRTTGLYNMRARSYDPASGRFTQREPMATPVGVPLVSAYSFVANRPTVFTDPTGLSLRPSTLQPQVTENADAAYDAKLAVTATQVSIKVGNKILTYAATAGKSAAEVAAASGTAAAKASAAKVRAAGIGLAVIGIGIQTYITYERCNNGPVESCVAATVSLAISVGFTVGCSFITAGAASFACAIAGAALSIAFDLIISEYGPVIASAFVDLYTMTGAALSTAAAWTADAFDTAAAAITAEYDTAVGTLTSGFNDAGLAITSGYEAAITGLAEAGYQAEQIANLLRDSFDLAARDTVAALENLGYDIQATAEALATTFLLTAEQTAQLLKDGFDAAASDVAAALEGAYDITVVRVADALALAEYGVSEVAGALEDTYALAADEIAGFLDDVGYEFGQIAAALTDGLGVLLADLDEALAQLDHTVGQLASAMKDFYDLTATAAADALKAAGYVAEQVASALQDAYLEAAAAVAQILNEVGFLATAVADALRDVYGATAAAVTQFLKDAGYFIDDIALALEDVFNSTATDVATFFKNVGYTVVQIGDALEAAFAATAATVSSILAGAGFVAGEVALALQDAYGVAVEAVSSLLEQARFAAAEVAGALTSVYQATALQVTQFLQAAGYALDEVALALQSTFALAAAGVAGLMRDAGYAVAEIGEVLSTVFGQAAAAAAATLQSIGAAASEIATMLEDAFGQAVNEIGGLLTGLGFSSSVIADIGGAFEDFGSAVEDFFSSLF